MLTPRSGDCAAGTERQAEEIIAKVEKLPLMQDPFPLPKDLLEFRDILWTAHVQNNQAD